MVDLPRLPPRTTNTCLSLKPSGLRRMASQDERRSGTFNGRDSEPLMLEGLVLDSS